MLFSKLNLLKIRYLSLMRLIVSILVILSSFCFFNEKVKQRFPAQVESNSGKLDVVDNLKKACDEMKDLDSPICAPYRNVKKTITEEAKSIEKSIRETINPEIGAVSAFVLKSVYEQKVTLEYRTPYGKPSVSFWHDQTFIKWSISEDF